MNDTALALTCFGIQSAVGCIVLFRVWRSIGPLRKMLLQSAAAKNNAWLASVSIGNLDTSPAAAKEERLQPVLALTKDDLKQLDAYRKTLTVGGVFESHVRSEANFVKDNVAADLVMPPPCALGRARMLTAPLTLTIIVFRNSGTRNMMWNAVGFALITSSIVSLVWLGEMQGADSAAVDAIDLLRTNIAKARSGFNFMVAFLLLGLLNFVVGRWREYLVTCQTVQSKLQDLAINIGGAVIDGDDAATRSRLFQLYRYLNVAHAMTYIGQDAKLPQTAGGFRDLGLLTPAEVSVLEPLANCAVMSIADKQRETVLGWVGGVLTNMVRANQVQGSFHPPSCGMVAGVRAACARYDDLAVRHMPNLWLACTHTLMVTLIVLLDLELAFNLNGSVLDVKPHLMLLCASITVFFAALIITGVYVIAWAMIKELSAPFGADSDDDYNPDALLGSTERSLFGNLRTSFDRARMEAGLGEMPLSTSKA